MAMGDTSYFGQTNIVAGGGQIPKVLSRAALVRALKLAILVQLGVHGSAPFALENEAC